MRHPPLSGASLILLLAAAACAPATRPLAAAPAPPEGFAALERSDAGYRAVYPKEWTPRTGTEARFQNFVSPDRKSILLISVAANRHSDPELERAGALFEVDALQGIAPIRSPQQRRTKVNGATAVEQTGEYALGNDQLTMRYYTFNHADRTWVLAYLGPTDRFPVERVLFEQFARGFTVLDGKKLPAHLAQIGRPAPAFALTGIDGQPVRLADFRGRPVLLNFWASWCLECRIEMPTLNQAHGDWGSRGLALIGINYGEDRSRAAAYAREMDIRFPLALDPQRAAARAYGVLGPPTSFFIDRDGIVREIGVGLLNRENLAVALSKIIQP